MIRIRYVDSIIIQDGASTNRFFIQFHINGLLPSSVKVGVRLRLRVRVRVKVRVRVRVRASGVRFIYLEL